MAKASSRQSLEGPDRTVPSRPPSANWLEACHRLGSRSEPGWELEQALVRAVVLVPEAALVLAQS